MSINAILACDKKFGIGYNSGLPWPHNSTDLKWFKRQTNNGVVLMGRATWESIGSKPLPNRTNIVISSKELEGPDLVLSGSMDLVLQEAVSRVSDCDVWVIGGADVYEQAFPHCDALYLTLFNGEYTCDKYIRTDLLELFPRIDYYWKHEEGFQFQIRTKQNG